MAADKANMSNVEAVVRAQARDLDHDRYLAALLSPASVRGLLMTLAAFHGEVARIPVSVREPAMGDIRLQWWREALAPACEQEVTGSPLADSLRQAIRANTLPVSELMATIDAYAQLLHPGSLHDASAISAFADATQGAAFRMAARVLDGDKSMSAASLTTAAAQAYGRVQLLRTLPDLLAKGRNPFGGDANPDWSVQLEPLLAQARASLSELRRLAELAPATILPAILPAALVEPYLAALENLGRHIVLEQASISPLSRMWRIFQASWRGRF